MTTSSTSGSTPNPIWDQTITSQSYDKSTDTTTATATLTLTTPEGETKKYTITYEHKGAISENQIKEKFQENIDKLAMATARVFGAGNSTVEATIDIDKGTVTQKRTGNRKDKERNFTDIRKEIESSTLSEPAPVTSAPISDKKKNKIAFASLALTAAIQWKSTFPVKTEAARPAEKAFTVTSTERNNTSSPPFDRGEVPVTVHQPTIPLERTNASKESSTAAPTPKNAAEVGKKYGARSFNDPPISAEDMAVLAKGSTCVAFYKNGPTACFGNFANVSGGIKMKQPDGNEYTYKNTEAAFQHGKWLYALKATEGDSKNVNLREELIKKLKDIDFTKLDGSEAQKTSSHELDGKFGKLLAGTQWHDGVKQDIMMTALKLKFAQPPFKELLAATKPAGLLEHNAVEAPDNYWSNGKDGTGVNALGQMLMAIRDDTPTPNLIINPGGKGYRQDPKTKELVTGWKKQKNPYALA